MTAAERRLIAYTTIAHALVHSIEVTYAVLLLRIQLDFGTSDVLMGVIASIFGWAFGATAIPAGFLTDRLGSRRVLYYTFVGATGAAVLVGLSPNQWFLAGALALLGLTIGLYHPAGISLIAQGVRQRGLGLGYHGVSGNLGLALTPLIAGGLASAFDWRAAYFLMAGLAGVVALMLGATRLPVQGESEVVSPHDPLVSEGATARLATPKTNSTLVPLLLVYLAFVFNGFVYRGVITFLPSHIHDEVSANLGDALTTVALLTGAAGQYVGGALSQRVQLERLAPLIVMLAVPSLFLTGIIEGGPLVVFAAALIFFNFAGQPVFTGLIADYTPARLLGRSYGISFFASFGLASVGSTYAGFFADRWNTTSAVFTALTPFAAATLLIAATLWLISLRRPLLAPSEAESQPPVTL